LLARRTKSTPTVQASNVAVTTTISADRLSSVIAIRGPSEFGVDMSQYCASMPKERQWLLCKCAALQNNSLQVIAMQPMFLIILHDSFFHRHQHSESSMVSFPGTCYDSQGSRDLPFPGIILQAYLKVPSYTVPFALKFLELVARAPQILQPRFCWKLCTPGSVCLSQLLCCTGPEAAWEIRARNPAITCACRPLASNTRGLLAIGEQRQVSVLSR
jgi:hypothetical protein